MTEEPSRSFIPASGHDFLLPFYDPLVRLLGGDRVRKQLLELTRIRRGHRVLDIGCGTGTLVAMIQRLHPEVEVVGLDPDPKALARARRKVAGGAGVVRLDRGFSDELPYPEEAFDRVLSSFMLHHLEGEEKARTLAEVRRVLKPGGSLLLVDFGGSQPGTSGFLHRWLHSSHSSHLLDDNSEERVLALMRQARLRAPTTVGRATMLFGHLPCLYYQAMAPAPQAAPR